MSLPVVIMANGGLPVTVALGTAGLAQPMTVAENGIGLGVTIVSDRGLPVLLYDEAGDPYEP
jgi:hypothetical protein